VARLLSINKLKKKTRHESSDMFRPPIEIELKLSLNVKDGLDTFQNVRPNVSLRSLWTLSDSSQLEQHIPAC
jgi:hypothetical protein